MPSPHSSSSHSSHSHSSSGSFRSSGSHASASRSSYSSRSSGSRPSSPSRSARSSPSGHSTSSHSSRPLSGGSAPSANRQQSRPATRPVSQPSGRPRVNQPVGFLATQALRPIYYYGRRHDYVYYPESWTDAESGRRYEKGYYDENGEFYDSVAFQKNGRYENVVCYCQYCGTESLLNLDNRSGSTQTMLCPGCGAPLEIRSVLDEIADEGPENTHVYRSEESLKNAFGRSRKNRVGGLAVTVILAAVLIITQTVRSLLRAPQEMHIPDVSYQQGTLYEPDESAGDTLFVERQSDGSYHVVSDVVRADRILYYDAYADSFYDEDSGCWVWRNTDVEPAVWQYWVEGISSDFGDYGWMEHDADGWWIEVSEGSWIPLPEVYAAEDLWYIE